MIFGPLNPEQIWHENLTDLSTSTHNVLSDDVTLLRKLVVIVALDGTRFVTHSPHCMRAATVVCPERCGRFEIVSTGLEAQHVYVWHVCNIY